ncbi:MAG: hypothetical protein HQK84_12270 [Nitrospinae bacterium]|nr:hypothetical protein [Nitrospinota bacterium]
MPSQTVKSGNSYNFNPIPNERGEEVTVENSGNSTTKFSFVYDSGQKDDSLEGSGSSQNYPVSIWGDTKKLTFNNNGPCDLLVSW